MIERGHAIVSFKKENLIKTSKIGGEGMVCNSLEEVRMNIDRIDDEIIKLIAERGTYVVQAS